MQKIILLVCAIGTGALAHAQKNESFEASKKVEITAGEVFRESKGILPEKIWAHSSDGFYLEKAKRGIGNRDIVLARYKNDLSLDFEVELDVSELEKGRRYVDVMEWGDKFIVLSSGGDKKEGASLYWNELSRSTLKLDPKSNLIGEISSETGKKMRGSGFSFRTSRDDSKFLVHQDLPFEKGEPEKFEINVFDQNLTKLWSKKVTLPYNDDLFTIENYRVTDAGDVVVVGQLFREKDDRERKEKNYKTILLTYESQGSVSNEYEINLAGKLIADMNMAITEKEVICAGFYRTLETKGLQGSFFVKLDRASKAVIHESIKEFSLEFIQQDMTEKAAGKLEKKDDAGKDVGLSSRYDLKDFILREDGGVVMIGELYYVTTSTTQTQNGSTTTYTYHYYDLIVVSVDPTGDIQWAQKIPKRQRTTNDGGYFSSFVSAVIDDKIYIIFNDNPENLAYNGNGKPDAMRLKDAFASLITIDSDGRIFREALMSTREDRVIIVPKLSEQVSDEELILFASRKKDKAFYRVKFKK